MDSSPGLWTSEHLSRLSITVDADETSLFLKVFGSTYFIISLGRNKNKWGI